MDPILTITTAAPETGAYLTVVVCQIERWLRQIRRLHDTANLDCTFFLDELANQIQ